MLLPFWVLLFQSQSSDVPGGQDLPSFLVWAFGFSAHWSWALLWSWWETLSLRPYPQPIESSFAPQMIYVPIKFEKHCFSFSQDVFGATHTFSFCLHYFSRTVVVGALNVEHSALQAQLPSHWNFPLSLFCSPSCNSWELRSANSYSVALCCHLLVTTTHCLGH